MSEDELRAALMQQARRFSGQERMVYEYYEKNPQALAELRAPIYEERVVDHISKLIKITDKTVAKGTLTLDDGQTIAMTGHGQVMDGAITVRFRVEKDAVWRPRFPAYRTPPLPGLRGRAEFATTGLPIRDDGANEAIGRAMGGIIPGPCLPTLKRYMRIVL